MLPKANAGSLWGWVCVVDGVLLLLLLLHQAHRAAGALQVCSGK